MKSIELQVQAALCLSCLIGKCIIYASISILLICLFITVIWRNEKYYFLIFSGVFQQQKHA